MKAFRNDSKGQSGKHVPEFQALVPVDVSRPSFRGLASASRRATIAARGASRKTNSRCEITLRQELSRLRLRYRLHHPRLPGRPDIVFSKEKVLIFCDGDFWHGRNLQTRLVKLSAGHNAPYWVSKIRRNVERDREVNAYLRTAGWRVIRVWETDILSGPTEVASRIAAIVRRRRRTI